MDFLTKVFFRINGTFNDMVSHDTYNRSRRNVNLFPGKRMYIPAESIKTGNSGLIFTRNSFILMLVILMLFPVYLHAQKKGGKDCTVASLPWRIITLPFTQTDTLVKTTAPLLDQVNDYDGTNTTFPDGMSKGYVNGRDYLYRFTASQTGPVEIQLTYIPNAKCFSLLLFEAAAGPSLGQCIAYDYEGSTAGVNPTGLLIIANAKAGQDYFVMVDCWNWYVSSFSRSRYNISIKYNLLQTACVNVGFESGDFSNWYGSTGRSMSCDNPLAQHANYCAVNPGTGSSQFSIVSGGTDPVCGISRVLNGNYSAMLGDGTNNDAWGAQLIQTFIVTPATNYYIYNYALIVEDGYHEDTVQAFAKISTYDENGDTLPGAQYLVRAGPGRPGFIQVGTSDVWYLPWKSQPVNLSSQVGKIVTVIFTLCDCSGTAHYAYGYFDNDFSETEPLPIEMSDFSAENTGNAISLKWVTETEQQSDFFTIERSPDCISYNILEKIYAAGYSAKPSMYCYIDKEPIEGISYYRLKQTDYDGKTTIFGPVAVSFEITEKEEFMAYPVPFNDYINIVTRNESLDKASVYIMRVSGEVIKSFSIGSGLTILDMSDIPSGIYFLRYIAGSIIHEIQILK